MYPYPTLAQFKRRDGNMTTAVEATQDRENILEPDSSRPMYKPQLLCLGKISPLLLFVFQIYFSLLCQIVHRVNLTDHLPKMQISTGIFCNKLLNTLQMYLKRTQLSIQSHFGLT